MFFERSENPIITIVIGVVVFILLLRFGYRYYKNISEDRGKATSELSKEGRIEAERRNKAILPWLVKSKMGTWDNTEREELQKMALAEKDGKAKISAQKLEEAIQEEEARLKKKAEMRGEVYVDPYSKNAKAANAKKKQAQKSNSSRPKKLNKK